VFNVSTNTV